MLRRRIGKKALDSMLIKNSFHTRKKNRFSMTTRVRSRLAYPEDAPSPIGLLFFEIAHGTRKRAYTDLKEYQPRKKIQNQNKTKILLCKKF
jgi:hypothetical protein